MGQKITEGPRRIEAAAAASSAVHPAASAAVGTAAVDLHEEQRLKSGGAAPASAPPPLDVTPHPPDKLSHPQQPAVSPAHASRSELRTVFGALTPGVGYSDQQIDELREAAVGIERTERQLLREAFARATGPAGRAVIAELRADPRFQFDAFAAREGPLRVIELVDMLSSSPEAYNLVKENFASLSRLAKAGGNHPLELLVHVPFGAEHPVVQLLNPEYLARIQSDRAQKVIAAFGSFLERGGMSGVPLPTTEALIDLTNLSDQQLKSLRKTLQYLTGNSSFKAEHWNILNALQQDLGSGKLPARLTELLESHRETLKYISDHVDSISLVDSASDSDAASERHVSMSLATAADLLQRPEITPANLEWLHSTCGQDLLGRVVRSEEHPREREPGTHSPEPRSKLLAELKSVLEAKRAIAANLRVIRDHEKRLASAIGAASGWDNRPATLEELKLLAKIDAKKLVEQIDRLPAEQQTPVIWGGVVHDKITEYTAAERKAFDRCLEWEKGLAASSEAQKQKQEQDRALLDAFFTRFPDVVIPRGYGSEYLVETLQRAGISSPQDLHKSETQKRISDAGTVLDQLGARRSLGNLAALLEKPGQIDAARSNDAYVRFLYRTVADSIDCTTEGGAISGTLHLVQKLTPQQRALLGFGPDPRTGKSVPPGDVEAARAYLRAVLTIGTGAPLYLDPDRLPLDASTIAVGKTLETLLDCGLSDESVYEGRAKLLDPLLANNSPALAQLKLRDVEGTRQADAHVYAVIQQPNFHAFLHKARAAGLKLVDDTRSLGELMADFGKEKFEPEAVYTAYRMYMTDRENNQVLSKLLDMKVEVSAETFNHLALDDFLSWKELQQAVTNPAVHRFLEQHRHEFTTLLPHDLVVINERILPRLQKDGTAFLQSDEYREIRRRMRGEFDVPTPPTLRYNHLLYQPSMQATLLELKEQGVDFRQGLAEGEKLAARIGVQARLSDALAWQMRDQAPRIAAVFRDPAAAGAKLDQTLRPIYSAESRSGDYRYRDTDEEKRLTRPALERMHPLTKAKIATFLDGMQDPAFVRDIKRLALESWEREYPFALKAAPGGFALEVRKNLMGEEKGKVSAYGYDSNIMSTSLIEGHTHPSQLDGKKLAKYRAVPSGIDFKSGDLETARFSRGALMVSIDNADVLQRHFERTGETLAQLLERAKATPSLIDNVKINIDAYYLDRDHRKSNLDLGVY